MPKSNTARTKSEWLKSIQHSRKSLSGKPYEYLNLPDHVSSTYRVRFKCPDHGTYEVYAFSHLTHGCRDCGKKRQGKTVKGRVNHRRFSLTDAIAKAKSIHEDIDYTEVVQYDPHLSWWVTCLIHRHRYEVNVRGHLWDNIRGCSICRSERKKETSSKLSVDRRWAFDKVANQFNYDIVKYDGACSPATLKCPSHGEFTVSAAKNLAQGWSICPACRKGSSSVETLLKTRLEAEGLVVHLHRRDLLNKREIDIYLPEHKVGIEVNGIFWHSDKHASKGQNYHIDKTKDAKAAGINLLQFLDSEILGHTDLVVSMVLAKCRLFKTRLGARNTKVTNISAASAKRFMEVNHLQGFIGGESYIALVQNNVDGKRKIVALAIFGVSRFSKKANWELLRFASKQGYQVIGGLSKLLADFRKSHLGSIVSYANLRYSTGLTYIKAGFRFHSRSKPSYIWCTLNETLSRYQTQKHKLIDVIDDYDPDLSERDNMEANGFLRLWDCGNLVFILD